MDKIELKKELKKLPGWKYSARAKAIQAEFEMKGFLSAVRFINRIAAIAARMDHHPDLHLTRYRRLRIVLSSHSAGDVTEKDVVLAKRIQTIRQELV
jgi:4a-hydroxytetrahydrobiopterin dehydratase